MRAQIQDALPSNWLKSTQCIAARRSKKTKSEGVTLCRVACGDKVNMLLFLCEVRVYYDAWGVFGAYWER